ncbi:MAG: hypothetical protein A2104_02800 [Candidatus Melainabacteria bacterium GWF2_32_7]|nr:MAG: hypothetical protein A2104_02800 [Candidatus Melainabacteria bacterium GWF2_32_7]
MVRNKATEFKIIQQITGKNMGAVNILCACADKDRFDIVEFIRNLNKQDANNAITSEMIVKLYTEKCNSNIDKFISLIDKQFDMAKEMHKYFEY